MKSSPSLKKKSSVSMNTRDRTLQTVGSGFGDAGRATRGLFERKISKSGSPAVSHADLYLHRRGDDNSLKTRIFGSS